MNFHIINSFRICSVYSKGKGGVKLLRTCSVGVPTSARRHLYDDERFRKNTLSRNGGFVRPVTLCSSLRSPFHYHFLLYSNNAGKEASSPNEEKKQTLLQRFKQMYRDYWYVLVPVHVATSIVWFGSFYYIAKSGVDVAALMKSIGFGESIVSPLRDSSAGHLAVAYAMYKIATPARYTVTLGGTTISIKYLKQWGYIKPIPPKEKLKEMYAEKVESYRERREQMVESYRETKESVRSGFQEAKESITQGLRQGLTTKKTENVEKKVPNDKSKDCTKGGRTDT